MSNLMSIYDGLKVGDKIQLGDSTGVVVDIDRKEHDVSIKWDDDGRTGIYNELSSVTNEWEEVESV